MPYHAPDFHAFQIYRGERNVALADAHVPRGGASCLCTERHVLDVFLCFRSIAENVTSRWQTLMYHAEERLKLVMASMNWFKTAEQVSAANKGMYHNHPREHEDVNSQITGNPAVEGKTFSSRFSTRLMPTHNAHPDF